MSVVLHAEGLVVPALPSANNIGVGRTLWLKQVGHLKVESARDANECLDTGITGTVLDLTELACAESSLGSELFQA